MRCPQGKLVRKDKECSIGRKKTVCVPAKDPRIAMEISACVTSTLPSRNKTTTATTMMKSPSTASSKCLRIVLLAEGCY